MKDYGYKNLIVWQKSIELTKEIYTITDKFPKSELFGLVSQMRRAAISIPSNIAEGSKRKTKKDFQRFLVIAYGSGSELETQLEIAKILAFSNNVDYSRADVLLEEIMKMLNKMTSST